MKRRFLQFSLRALLVAMMCVAIPCATFGRKIVQKRREREIVKLINDRSGWVQYDWEITRDGTPRGNPRGWRWCRAILGDDFFSKVTVVYCQNVTDGDLELIAGIDGVERMTLGYGENPPTRHVTDAGLAHLKRLSNLRSLAIGCPDVTDAGIAELQNALPDCGVVRWPIPKQPSYHVTVARRGAYFKTPHSESPEYYYPKSWRGDLVGGERRQVGSESPKEGDSSDGWPTVGLVALVCAFAGATVGAVRKQALMGALAGIFLTPFLFLAGCIVWLIWIVVLA